MFIDMIIGIIKWRLFFFNISKIFSL